MTLTRLLTAAGFAALLATGAAYAQEATTTTHVDQYGNVVTTTTTIDPVTGLPVSASATTAGTPAAGLVVDPTGVPGTVSTRTVTNGPVPDTAENRAKYGGPMSRAGRATTPAGN